MVRKKIGATLSGDAVLQHVQSSYIRAPKLLGMLRAGGRSLRFPWGKRMTAPDEIAAIVVFRISGRAGTHHRQQIVVVVDACISIVLSRSGHKNMAAHASPTNRANRPTPLTERQYVLPLVLITSLFSCEGIFWQRCRPDGSWRELATKEES